MEVRREKMKIGIISDIHGNILALETIFQKFEKQNIEQVLCCGDVIGLGPHPEETVQFLVHQKNVIGVRGNHEGYLLEGIPDIIHGRPIREIERAHHEWVHQCLSEESISYLHSYPKEKFIEIEGKKIYFTHYPLKTNGEYKPFYLKASEEEMKELFCNINADICFFGHTHVLNYQQVNGKKLINVGSLGCSVKENDAYVGLLEITQNQVEYQVMKVEYDADSVRKEIQVMNYPFATEALIKFF